MTGRREGKAQNMAQDRMERQLRIMQALQCIHENVLFTDTLTQGLSFIEKQNRHCSNFVGESKDINIQT